MRDTDKVLANKIFKHYGPENQLKKLREELCELVEEIDKGTDPSDSAFISELADVLVMAHQWKEAVGDRVVNATIYKKLSRQLKRML